MADEENQEQDKLKEFIDSVEISIPSEVWAELEKKRLKLIVLALLGTVGAIVLMNYDPEFWFAIFLPWVFAFPAYKQAFRSTIVARVLEFVTGVRADNNKYSSSSNELFAIEKTVDKCFNLSTSGMEFDRQFCSEIDGWEANFCTFWKETGGEHKRIVYWYQMLQISKPDFETEGEILIKTKESSVAKGLIKKFTNVGVANAVKPAKDLEEVKLISPEFNEQFSAYADDQVSVRKFLKPAFMEHFASTVAKEFRAIHIKGGIVSMLSHGGFEEMKLLVASPNLIQGADKASSDRISKSIKKNLVTNLESHYKNVMRLRELLKI